MSAYYNEFDPFAAQWLRNLIAAGLIAPGEVDERSIRNVAADDLRGFQQCHFFAGIGGWSLAARLAGWPDDRELWTGSAPCQPFSVAGKGKAQADDRHLWPDFFRLIEARRPAVLMGEQVAAAVGKGWVDGVLADLEGIGYAGRAVVVPACSVDAPHKRDRLWFVADTDEQRAQVPLAGRLAAIALAGSTGDSHRTGVLADTDLARPSEAREQRSGQFGGAGGDPRARDCSVADTDGDGSLARAHGEAARHGHTASASHWAGADWLIGHDGKARRAFTDVRGVVDGLPEGLAGLCADYYAEATEGLIVYAETTKCRPGEVLRAVREAASAEALRTNIGGFFGVPETKVLLAFLCELEGRIKTIRASREVTADARDLMRSVRIRNAVARTSQGRRLHEQHAGEHSDPLHVLSQLLARAARQAFAALCRNAPIGALLERGVPARVGKLRAFGNAIVPQVAAEVIGAYMDCRP